MQIISVRINIQVVFVRDLTEPGIDIVHKTLKQWKEQQRVQVFSLLFSLFPWLKTQQEKVENLLDMQISMFF